MPISRKDTKARVCATWGTSHFARAGPSASMPGLKRATLTPRPMTCWDGRIASCLCWQEGLFMLFTLWSVGVVGWLGIIAYLVNPSWMAWSAVPLPDWLRWTGVGVFVVAGGLLIWTFRSLGKNLTDTVVTRREHTLGT